MENEISEISASLIDENIYESIISENTSMYFSPNQTLKERTINDNEDVADCTSAGEEFSKSNKGTEIKKMIDSTKSPALLMVNKSKLKFKALKSQTSTPSRIQNSEICQSNKEKSTSKVGEISGIGPLLGQQDSQLTLNCFKEIQEDGQELFLQTSSVTGIQRISINQNVANTTSLADFEKFEKILEETEEFNLNDVSEINSKSLTEYIKNLELNEEKSDSIAQKNIEVLNQDDFDDENKENICVDLLPQKNDTKFQVLPLEPMEIEGNINAASAVVSSDTSIKTVIERSDSMQQPFATSKYLEDSSAKESEYECKSQNLINGTNKSHAAGGVNNAKKKIRRSIRSSENAKKSLIEETDDSSGGTPLKNKHNEKFQKLNCLSKKILDQRQIKIPLIRIFKANKNESSNEVINKNQNESNSLKGAPLCSKFEKSAVQTKNLETEAQKDSVNIKNNSNFVKIVAPKTKVSEIAAEKVVDPNAPVLKVTAADDSKPNRRQTTFKAPTIPSVAKKAPRISLLTTASKKSPSLNLLKVKPRFSVLTKPRSSPLNAKRRSLARPSIINQQTARKSIIPVSVAANKKPIVTTTGTSSTTVSNTVSKVASTVVESTKTTLTLFTCRICHRSFKFKTELENHKKTHFDISIKCEHCDRNFAFRKALDNHLIENCTKIPPLVKKRLINSLMKEKNDEKILQKVLSSAIPSTSSQSSKIQSQSVNSKLNLVTPSSSQHSLNTATESSTMKSTSSLSCDNVTLLMPPPSSSSESSSVASQGQRRKIKRNQLPHSGVYRTPNKLLKCHICNAKFLNVILYTQHIMSHTAFKNQENEKP